MSPVYDGLLSAQKSTLQLVTKVVSYTIVCVLILICLVSIPRYVVEALSLFRLNEAGYGDSYILYDVLHFQKTGIIYRDLSQPPYLPAQYSPLVYVLYSLPARIVSWVNPFVGPRLMALTAFLICVGMVASIVRTLIPSRFAWVWGILLPFSGRSMSLWILQIRSDFPGISLSLLAIRLLLSESRWAVPLAGVCAGLSMQLKITFVAAAATGALWLSVQRRWKDVAGFAALVTISSAGPYLLYSLREPRMIRQIFALSPGITNISGNLHLMDKAIGELVVLLAVFGLASIEWRLWPKGTIIALFAAISFAVAALTDMQAGGNINYYFELFFAVVPISILGVFRLSDLAGRSAVLGLALVSVLVIHFLAPASEQLYSDIGVLRNGWVESDNAKFRQLEHALAGRRIFSGVPRLALLDPDPPLMEPYLLSYLHRLGKIDLAPITEPLRRKEYDVVITNDSPVEWRGISHMDSTLREAIASSYQLHCHFEKLLFHLPNDVETTGSTLAADLRRIGCAPVSANTETNW